MKWKAKSGDIASFLAKKKIQSSTQEEACEGNEGEGSKLERSVVSFVDCNITGSIIKKTVIQRLTMLRYTV